MEDTKSQLSDQEKIKSGKKYVIFILLFLAITTSYGIRTLFFVAIISMTDERVTNSTIPTHPEWKNADTMMSSFFWGYFVPQIVAGQLCERFGPKWFLTITMTIGGLFNTLIPLVANSVAGGSTGVILCRVIIGLNQGFLYPAIHVLLSKWTTLSERSKASAFVWTGSSFGTVIALPITGMVCASKLGWPSIFYIYGGISCLWAIVWSFLGINEPKTTRESTLEEIEGNNKKVTRTPWKAVAKSLPMWAILVGECGQVWGFFTLLTQIPTYLANYMELKIQNNGQLSALPYVVRGLLGLIGGAVVDKLVVSRTLTVRNVRKLAQSICSFIPAVALLWLSFMDKSQVTLGVALLILAVGSTAGTQWGSFVNHIDIAPNHAGTLVGITNTLAVVCSMLAPLVLEFFGNDKKNQLFWRKVFFSAAGIYVVTGFFYLIFGSGEKQPWDEPEKNKNDTQEASKLFSE